MLINMKTIPKKLPGSALLISLLILTGVFVAAFGAGFLSFFNTKNTDVYQQATQARLAAESGAEYAKLMKKGACTAGNTSITVGRSRANVEISCYDANNLLFATSTGILKNSQDVITVDNLPYLNSLILFLKADGNLIAFASSKDIFVTAWGDASSETNDAGQVTAANQPKLIKNALNGKPVLRFFKDAPTYLNLTAPVDLRDYTIFAVYKFTDPAPANPLYYYLGGNAQGVFGGGSNFSDPNYNYGVYAGGAVNADDVPLTNWGIVTHYKNKLYKNGVEPSYNYTGTASPLTFSQIGALEDNGDPRWPFEGDIAEILVYNEALSDTQRIAVEEYLSKKYNINL
ncbi:hypothetical protein COT98_03580 [Candidatus Falkowbacteria bacterium CG10_big_fil_rev_8_21_14_0_10_39_9]|uniref:LamG-like jellyroll fold domain-containing protein n=1 Tax=Candidatus Falkowbacteria bacterium CG10_big_fil_rev_8_21_14_0_10_39_9 TaxID=1974566 RepID=A0A2M6WNS2_9BACT|nr:MAG: hypothetical protein COT98_03580 [Candidatus Falkowbacteria bacterium CG10_big_fil_rev_8_21_14_0_10_39_9]